jgi:diadenosine tetraphosphate (Ap4A) HIT family hydrolase
MRNLYAPWRMEYIEGPTQPGCLFCRLWAAPAEEDRRNLVVQRGEGAMVVMNRFPYNNGHLMIAPRHHTSSLTGLDDAQTLALMRLVRRSLEVLQTLMKPQGFNVGLNLGRVAGAGIPVGTATPTSCRCSARSRSSTSTWSGPGKSLSTASAILRGIAATRCDDRVILPIYPAWCGGYVIISPGQGGAKVPSPFQIHSGTYAIREFAWVRSSRSGARRCGSTSIARC